MVYPDNFETKIGFDVIRQQLKDCCLGDNGRDNVDKISFSYDSSLILSLLKSVNEFQQLLKYDEGFPADSYYNLSGCLRKIRVEGTFPEIREVFDLKRSLETVRSILNFFKAKDDSMYPELKKICAPIKNYPFVIEAIDRILDKYGNIKDTASPRLKEIRSEINSKGIQVSRKLSSILKQAQSDGIVDPDTTVSIRNGRGVIPVNAYDKRKIQGLVHDHSSSGKTAFVEPEEVVELNNQIVELESEERREIVKILIKFANDIRPYIDDLLQTNEFLGEIDVVRAKALLGNDLNSILPIIVDKPLVSWRKAAHPLLVMAFKRMPGRKLVPLDINLDEKDRILVISGPNAGGKSVCLKTVGLLQYMLQCGLTIPVEEGSEAGFFKEILIDIGDEQSIENDLSTYSSHLVNMKYFLKYGSDKSLILIDEFGTGTEPMIGGAIAEAVLNELNNKKVFGVLTTHYTNLKHFASSTEGIVNGAMAFDNHLMQPLFQLNMGKPGSSFAFEIAKKIGLPDEILNNASVKAGVKNVNYDKALKDIARDKRYWENKRQNIRQHEKRLEELMANYEKELAGAKSMKKEILSKAKEEAETLLKESNRVIENTIRQIKESQAEKERTREARKQLEEFKTVVEDNSKEEDDAIERKIAQLTAKAERLQEKKLKKLSEQKNTEEEPTRQERPLQVGDAIRMVDTMAVGEIAAIKDGMIQVEAGSFKFTVKAERVERISRSEYKQTVKHGTKYMPADPAISERKLKFKPEIDIRGVRAEEAILQVQNFIDDAILVQHRNLRILHGKGNGVLREIVRQYLATVDIVKSFADEHVEFGGSGITIVEMDF